MAGLKPETLFADGGYPSVPSALKVIEKGIDFITPVNRSRLSDDVVGRDLFAFDPEGLVTKCPMGHNPLDHRVLSGNNSTRRSLHAIFDGRSAGHARCSTAARCGLPTIATKAAGLVIPWETSVWRSRLSFASGIRCMRSSRRLNGRTGTRYAQGSRRRTPS